MERGLLGHVLDAFEQCLVAMPTDFDPAIKISLRARHLENALGLESRLRPEDVRVRLEAYTSAAPVWHAARFLQLAFRLAPLESHPVKLLLARHFDFHALGQSVGNRDADTVQTA